MKKLIVYSIFLSFTLFANAQNKVETYLESWIASEKAIDQEHDFNEIYQVYSSIQFSTYDFYDFSKWEQFFFLNVRELKQIRTYLEQYKNEKSIAFLNTLKGFSREKAYLIRYKVLESQIQVGNDKIKQSIESYTSIPDSDESGLKNRTRLRVTYPNFRFFLQTEKDTEERSMIDFISAGIKLKRKNTIWYLGNYTAQFGLGASLFQGYQNVSITQMNNTFSDGFKIHTGTDENRFFRGIAVESYKGANKKLNAFISSNRVDGRWDKNGVSRLFSDGVHVSRLDQTFRKSIQLNHAGIGYSVKNKGLILSTLGYLVHYNKPLIMNSRLVKNQMSLSSTLSYSNSRIHVVTELNSDQFEYWSSVSSFRLHLGYAFYLKTYYGIENADFENTFRTLPTVYSNPERFYGYRLEILKKKTQAYFAYNQSQNQIEQFNKTSDYRFGLTCKLKKKSVLRFRGTFKQKVEEKDLELSTSKLFRGRLSFMVQERGFWSWKQGLFFKFGAHTESGLTYASQFEYKKSQWSLRLGYVFFQQNTGAFYIYESDILSSGYTRGFFHSGSLVYTNLKFQFRKLTLYNKLRVLHQKSVNYLGWSFGCKYSF